MKKSLCAVLFLNALCAVLPANANSGKHLIFKQILLDNRDGTDGLGNPRSVNILPDKKTVLVASGDDNAFATFIADDEFKLSFSQVFKNSQPEITGLEGASAIATYSNGKRAAISGFYDGALTLFAQNDAHFVYQRTISDGLGYDRVFDSNSPVGELDTYRLLGAWDVITTSDEKQLLTASYMSNAVAIFTISHDNLLTYKQALTTAKPYAEQLGKPISLALSPQNDELFVLGFEGNQLTIFNQQNNNEYTTKQVIHLDNKEENKCLNPQKLVVSPDANSLYIACSGSNSVAVYKRSPKGKFEHLQRITVNDVGGSGIEGSSSLAITSNGSMLFVAGEAGVGIHIFSADRNGKLTFVENITTANEHPLAKISSLTLTEDDKHLLVTTGKNNSLIVFEVYTH